MPSSETRERRYAAYCASMSRSVKVPVSAAAGMPSSRYWAASLCTSERPVSCPTGRAPAWHILIPLYWAGLWLAVNIAPGTSIAPEA